MTPAQHRQAREIVNGYEDRHKHLRGYYSRTDLLTVAKLALAQIIADCEEEERNDGSRVATEAKGRDRLDCVADFNPACVDSHTDYAKAMTVRKPEASSDPLAVAARLEESIRRAFEKVYGPEPQGVHYSVPSVLSPDDLWVTRWLTWQASWQAALEEMRKLLDMEGKL